jgi:lysophospholipase L1-like esterase
VNGNDHDGAIDPSTVMSYTDPDGLHLNDHGYDCWAKSMAGIIRMQAVNPMVSTLSKP